MIYISTNGTCISILSFSSSFVYVRLSEQGMQIHISQTTKDHLEHEPYIIEERGKIFVKVSVNISHGHMLSCMFGLVTLVAVFTDEYD